MGPNQQKWDILIANIIFFFIIKNARHGSGLFAERQVSYHSGREMILRTSNDTMPCLCRKRSGKWCYGGCACANPVFKMEKCRCQLPNIDSPGHGHGQDARETARGDADTQTAPDQMKNHFGVDFRGQGEENKSLCAFLLTLSYIWFGMDQFPIDYGICVL